MTGVQNAAEAPTEEETQVCVLKGDKEQGTPGFPGCICHRRTTASEMGGRTAIWTELLQTLPVPFFSTILSSTYRTGVLWMVLP